MILFLSLLNIFYNLYILIIFLMNKKLQELLEENQGNITEAVINEAMDYHNPKDFFEDLLQYGCVSWMVSSMIRYTDTHKFFDEHYYEIQEIRDELEDQWIEVKIPTNTDLKNFLSWLSFEQKAYELYNNLGMDSM